MSFIPEDAYYKEKVEASFNRQGFMAYIGAILKEIRPGYCEIHLPYMPSLSQQHGFFHAGIIGTLADNTAGYAAFTLMPPDASILTVEYKLNLMAPGDGELLVAQAEVIKPGRTLTICQSNVFIVKNNKKKRCATALVTLMKLENRSDAPD